jgi:uncharacterized membrane protein YcaP (DUF421 family)
MSVVIFLVLLILLEYERYKSRYHISSNPAPRTVRVEKGKRKMRRKERVCLRELMIQLRLKL